MGINYYKTYSKRCSPVRTSVNIKYDLGDTSLLDNYYATTAHSELIKSVMQGFTSENQLRSHIAYGPYGSGKSLVSTLLASIFSENFTKEHARAIAEKFKPVDDEISSILEEYSSKEDYYTYIPIILNGHYTNLQNVITQSLFKAISERGLKVSLPGTHEEILTIINRWRNHYPANWSAFEFGLSKHGYDLDDFQAAIKAREDDVVGVFDSIYKDITGGANFVSYGSHDVVEILEEVSAQLEDQGVGLVLVYDEFGRMLQHLQSDTQVNAFMQMLQDLAELANNGVDNLSLLFIAHRPLSYYFSFTEKSLRNEFAKVEKRFTVHEIKNDYATFLKITQKHIEANFNRYSIDDDLREELLAGLKKYNVFHGDLSSTEIENIIVDNLFPLHPIATYLLPRVSSVFGQNERTLFTFLVDPSDYGLTGFYNRYPKHLYYPDYLVDYFLVGIDESYVEDIKEYKIYKKNVESLSSLIPKTHLKEARRIYDFLLIWSMSKGQQTIKPTTEFISFSTGIDSSLANEALNYLKNRKLVRFNVIKEQWEIFEGSPVDVDALIEKQMAENPMNPTEFIQGLEKNNPYRFIWSEEYNSQYELTRFAHIQFVTKDAKDSFVIDPECDYNIVISMGFEYEPETPLVTGEIHSYSGLSDKLFARIHRLLTTQKMLNNDNLLKHTPNLNVELDHEVEKLHTELNTFYEKLIVDIYDNSEDLKIYLKNKFEEHYPHTLHIVNDQINMFRITNIQKKAINTVLHETLSRATPDLDDIFDGSKPADLVYYTVFEKLKKDEHNEKSLAELKKRLNQHIMNNPKDTFGNLFEIVVSPPFGIRPRVGLLLMFKLTIDKWKDMMLFSDNDFIPSIETEELVENILFQEDIQYVFSRFDNENRLFLEKLEDIFTDIGESTKEKALSVRVCSGMYNWYLSLPVITQQMIDVSLSQRKFLSIVSKSRINPKAAIDELLNTFTVDEIQQFKMSIEDHFDKFTSKLIDGVFTKLGINDRLHWAKQQKPIHKKNNRLVKAIIEGKDIFTEYADYIENIEPEKWTQSSFKTLETSIIADYNKLDEHSSYQVISINGQEKHVQDIKLSPKAENTLSNLSATIDATKRYYSDAELEQIILNLVKSYVQ